MTCRCLYIDTKEKLIEIGFIAYYLGYKFVDINLYQSENDLPIYLMFYSLDEHNKNLENIKKIVTRVRVKLKYSGRTGEKVNHITIDEFKSLTPDRI